MRILLSRTDSIGDVVLSIPMAGWLKANVPSAEVHFLAKRYTAPVLKTCVHVTDVILLEEVEEMKVAERVDFLRQKGFDAVVHVFPRPEIAGWMKAAGIPIRIGTMKRRFHFRTCTVRPWIGRRYSRLHESQLNLKLLAKFGYRGLSSLSEIGSWYGLEEVSVPSPTTRGFLSDHRFDLILHPRSLGSAREWGLSRFAELIDLLPPERFNIILTGTEKEGESFRGELLSPDRPHVHDSSGRLDLHQLNALISNADGLVAASTGPLHIAAAMGIHALGLFIAKPPMHPGRWAPVGPKAEFIIHDIKDKSLDSIARITADRVAERIMDWEAAQ